MTPNLRRCPCVDVLYSMDVSPQGSSCSQPLIQAYILYNSGFIIVLRIVARVHLSCNSTQILDHKIGIDLTVSSTLKNPSINYSCFVFRRFGLFLIHLQPKNKATPGNDSN